MSIKSDEEKVRKNSQNLLEYSEKMTELPIVSRDGSTNVTANEHCISAYTGIQVQLSAYLDAAKTGAGYIESINEALMIADEGSAAAINRGGRLG